MQIQCTAKIIVFAVCCAAALIHDASAMSCKGYLKEARASIGRDVESLRRYEQEASDRVKGLDSRPFEFLLGEARKSTAVIATPALLKRDESLKGCRNRTDPVHKICADAAQALVVVLEKHVAEPKPDYDRSAYANAVAECERLMDFKPLKSLIRGMD